jgi:hypothetical protein
MRKAIILGAAVAVAGVLTAVALAANGGNLKTFGDGDITVQDNKAAFVVKPGEYAGVYQNADSKPISKVRFHMVSYGDVGGGAPRFSIALDTDGNKKTTENYAFLDAANCGGVVGDNPTFAETTIDTDLANCKVIINTTPDATYYDNWAALVTAHPSWQTSKDASFVIADAPGDYHVKDISLFKLS